MSAPTPENRLLVFVCQGPSCTERGADATFAAMHQHLLAGDGTLRRSVRLCRTTCLDSCATGPNLVRADDRGLLTGIDAVLVDELLRNWTRRQAATD